MIFPVFRPSRPSRPLLSLNPMAEIIPIGSDQAVHEVKERLVEGLRVLGYEALDLGTRFGDGGLARRLDKVD
jgi:hypothetical protein